jgi:hypothetical protein
LGSKKDEAKILELVGEAGAPPQRTSHVKALPDEGQLEQGIPSRTQR